MHSATVHRACPQGQQVRWRPSDARLSFFNEMDGVGIHGVARGIPIRSKWRAVAAQAQIGRHCRRILGRGVSTVQRDTRALLLHGDGSESLFPGPDWCPSLGRCSRLEGFDSPRCLAFGHFLLGKIVEIGMYSPSNVCAPYRTTHTTHSLTLHAPRRAPLRLQVFECFGAFRLALRRILGEQRFLSARRLERFVHP